MIAPDVLSEMRDLRLKMCCTSAVEFLVKLLEHSDALIAAAEREQKPRCEHCGSDLIYHGPPDCPRCGAPNCCQVCCALEDQIQTANRKTLQAAELDAQLGRQQIELDECKTCAHEQEQKFNKAKERIAELEGLLDRAPHYITWAATETGCSTVQLCAHNCARCAWQKMKGDSQ